MRVKQDIVLKRKTFNTLPKKQTIKQFSDDALRVKSYNTENIHYILVQDQHSSTNNFGVKVT